MSGYAPYPNDESEFAKPRVRESLRDFAWLWCDVCGLALEDGGSNTCAACHRWAFAEGQRLAFWEGFRWDELRAGE